ncbi:MAG: glutamate--tRNA ligase [Planctomycetota bacterium]
MPVNSRPPRVRIAPSPTGAPHVGTAYVALFNRCFAQKHGGQFVLRIEDTDRTRSTRESEDAIYESLRWLGLDWDEGPDVGGPHAPYRQSERSEIYSRHANELIGKGAAYRCFCTPERLAELRETQKRDKLSTLGYDGHCREVSPAESERRAGEGESHVVRLRVPETGSTVFKDLLRKPVEIRHSEIDDQVLLKTDGFPTYHLANVVDDHLMGITHVLRAEEWIPSTPKHVLLYDAFGWEPPVFCHLPLLRNKDKSKISKRKNPTSLIWYRENGFLPEALLNFLSLNGWKPQDEAEVFGMERMLREFEPDQIHTSSPVFDLTKLEWLNGEYIRALPEDELAERIIAFKGGDLDRSRLGEILPLIRERMKTLAEFDTVSDFFYADEVALKLEDFKAAKKMSEEDRVAALKLARSLLDSAARIDHDSFETPLRDAAEERGWKVGDFFMCLRIAVTGKRATPPLIESMAVLGREVCARRIERAIEQLPGGA